MKKTIESSLLYTREGETQDFVHDSYKDYFLAKWFADRINSGKLSVRDAYRDYWSYEEDAELWDLPKDREWRVLLADWENILFYIVRILDDNGCQKLLEIVCENYFNLKSEQGELNYNPFLDELYLAAELQGLVSGPKRNRSRVVDELYRLAFIKIRDTTCERDIIEAIMVSTEFREDLFRLWDIGTPDIRVDIAIAIAKLGMLNSEARKRILANQSSMDYGMFALKVVEVLPPEQLEEFLDVNPTLRFHLLGALKDKKIFINSTIDFLIDENGRWDPMVAEYFAEFGIIVPGLVDQLGTGKVIMDVGDMLRKELAIYNLAKLRFYDDRILRIFEQAGEEIIKLGQSDESGKKISSLASLTKAATHYLGEMRIFHPELIKGKREIDNLYGSNMRITCYKALVRMEKFHELGELYRSSDNTIKFEIIQAMLEAIGRRKEFQRRSLSLGEIEFPEFDVLSNNPSTIESFFESLVKLRGWKAKVVNLNDVYCSDWVVDELKTRPVKTKDILDKKMNIIENLLMTFRCPTSFYREAIRAMYPRNGDVFKLFKDQPEYHKVHILHQRLKPRGYNPPVKKFSA